MPYSRLADQVRPVAGLFCWGDAGAVCVCVCVCGRTQLEAHPLLFCNSFPGTLPLLQNRYVLDMVAVGGGTKVFVGFDAKNLLLKAEGQTHSTYRHFFVLAGGLRRWCAFL